MMKSQNMKIIKNNLQQVKKKNFKNKNFYFKKNTKLI